MQILFDNRYDELNSLKRSFQGTIQLIKCFFNLFFLSVIKEITNNAYTPSRDVVKIIEAKLEQCQMVTSTSNPEQQGSLDDEEDETVSYERYSQYRDEQEMMDQEYIERTDRDRSSG